jgi:hypothetical protein
VRQAFLCDFHGTLVNVSSIRHYLKDRQYDRFYEESLSCPPIEETVEAVRRTHGDGLVNLLFTGMPERYVDGLNSWLARHDVPIDLIEMRVNGDYRKDFIVKRDMYIRTTDNGYYVVGALEDNPRIVDLWRGYAIPVTVVPGWDEDLTPGRVDNPSVPS